MAREGEQVEIIRLGDLTADQVDMLTLVQVGSSNTRHIDTGKRSWLYTPRGYQKKMESAQ